MPEADLLFYFFLAVIAFFYATVGHGGASGYLALMALFSFSPHTMRYGALVLNLFVAGIAFIQFYRMNHFKWPVFWPFAIASVPASFLGSLVDLDPSWYRKILGCFLILAVLRLTGVFGVSEDTSKKQNMLLSVMLGFAIGSFSGMIGIGGGIILSPLILVLGWADVKQTSAVSALFIFVNSLAGIAGLRYQDSAIPDAMIPMVCVAFVAGLAGSYWGARHLKMEGLKKMLALVLLLASVKLIFYS